MNAYFQKHKLKIFSIIFLIILIFPLLGVPKTASASLLGNLWSNLNGEAPAGESNSYGAEGATMQAYSDSIKNGNDAPVPGFWEGIAVIFLKIILNFVALLLSLAETVFNWIVNPDTMTSIMTNSAVYTVWRAVRDVFNVLFIMVLLFSAFATVFQISKYNYKNVLLNLILMALLVNFSYPMARFIIDLSNIIMFGFLQSMGGNNSFMSIINNSGLSYIFSSDNPTALFLLCAIIFTFILAMTLLIIAVLLVIRTVALTLYLMFSPLAFVGSVLPGTKLASTGNEWWTEFMKNCFAGPIIVFMLYVSNVMISSMATSGGKISTIVQAQTGSIGTIDNSIAKLLTGMSVFILPIITLWYGIIQAQKSGIAGANAVVSHGKKAAKWLAKNPALGSVGFAMKQSGITGSIQAKYKNYKDNSIFGKNRIEERIAARSGSGYFAVPGEKEKLDNKKIREAEDEHETKSMDANKLQELKQNGNRYEKAAAIKALAELEKADAADLKFIEDEFGNNSQAYRQVENKIKSYNPDMAFRKSGVSDADRRQKKRDLVNSKSFNPDNLNAEAFADDELLEIAFEEGAITNDQLDKAKKKSFTHARNIKKSLPAIAGNSKFNMDNLEKIKTAAEKKLNDSANPPSTERREELEEQLNKINQQIQNAKNVQIAHLAQLGSFHSSVKDETKKMLIKSLNQETASGLTDTTIEDNANLFAENINHGKLKEIITNMQDKAAAIRLIHEIKNNKRATTSNGKAANAIARKDPYLRTI